METYRSRALNFLRKGLRSFKALGGDDAVLSVWHGFALAGAASYYFSPYYPLPDDLERLQRKQDAPEFEANPEPPPKRCPASTCVTTQAQEDAGRVPILD